MLILFFTERATSVLIKFKRLISLLTLVAEGSKLLIIEHRSLLNRSIVLVKLFLPGSILQWTSNS